MNQRILLGGMSNVSNLFDITEFDSYKEDNRREVKKAKGGLPVSLWESYSAMANTYGGIIILGIQELSDRSWKTTGLKISDKEKILDNFWNQAHNLQKVSINLLNEYDVNVYEIQDDIIIVIHVPMAKREQKPVYINNDMFKGTYKRTHTGDYRCTPLQVKAMLRDQIEETMDMAIIESMDLSVFDIETIHAYRNRHRAFRAAHPWMNLDDDQYLLKIGAAKLGKDGKLHPTGAGLLMFGEEYNIVNYYPEYFLDYREMLDPTIRWTDRLQSTSGEWTGNLFDFYFRVYNKIIRNVKIPFKIVGGDRIDDTPVHRALREVLANCLVNADFYIPRGIVIKQDNDILTIENPGSIRVGKYQMKLGGESDPRNKALMKMFNLIGIGERAGSGVPELFSIWEEQQWKEPIIEEKMNPDRTILTLSFQKKVREKSARKKVREKKREKKSSGKTFKQYEQILSYMEYGQWYKVKDFIDILGVKERRVQTLLKELVENEKLIDNGVTKGKRYKKANK